MSPSTLMDDAVDDILLRLPPEDPASLVRASLVCKPWGRLLSEPTFAGRYRTFHRVPPLLGFLHNHFRFDGTIFPRFVPIPALSPLSSSPPADARNSWAIDCRHGRALIHNFEPPSLIVWDPNTNDQTDVPMPDYPFDTFTAAVLCTVDRCDHLDCSGGPFHLVFKGTDEEVHGVTWVSVYSSENGMWSVPLSIHIDPILNPYDVIERSLLVGDTVYFTLEDGKRALKYDMGRHVLSLISLPLQYEENMVLVSAEDGRLGIAGVEGYTLQFWWQLDPNGNVAEWVPGRVIELDMMLSIAIGDPSSRLHVVGFAERAGTVFISANAGIFTIETRSGRVRKVDESTDVGDIFPYESFFIPD